MENVIIKEKFIPQASSEEEEGLAEQGEIIDGEEGSGS